MNRSLYQEIIEHTTDAVIVTEDGPEGQRIVFVNDAYVQMTGYSKEDVIGMTPKILQGPETDAGETGRLRKALENRQPCQAELVNYKKSGERFWTSLSIFPITDDEGNCTHWIGIKRDITELKQKEQQISESLKEKESLLSEIHHRVKNNLAVISSLMQLQAMKELNGEIKDKLIDCVSRVRSIADVHEYLYQSESFSRIKLAEITKTLTSNIIDTFQPSTDVRLDFYMSPVYLHVNRAIPFSLIINEVITNILKHAFKGRAKGRIAVWLSGENHQISLTITDNGKPLPQDFDAQTSNGLGIHLIQVLAKQLNGSFRYEGVPTGTTFTFKIKPSDSGSIGNALI